MAKSKKKNVRKHSVAYPTQSGKVAVTRPSFTEGAGRLIDVAGAFRSRILPVRDADADRSAICDDWNAIGQDLGRAIRSYEERLSEKERALLRRRELVGSR